MVGFARLTSDPVAMEFFPNLLTREESDAYGHANIAHFEAHGFGRYVVELRSRAGFIGFSGLKRAVFDAPFTPAYELGYRFLPEFWGHGYATEAGRVAIGDGFERLEVDGAPIERVVAFTARTNERSQRVLERLQFVRVPENDFEHPLVEPGHALRPHLYYERSAGR